LRDLPMLLTRKRLRRRWVLYHGDEQIRISRPPDKLFRECVKRGLRNDEFYLGMIAPHPSEPEEIERSFYEFDDCEPVFMTILDRLPVNDEHYRLDVHGEPLRTRSFQIIVQVSISDVLTWDARTSTIPGVLDQDCKVHLEDVLRQYSRTERYG
jgi:hypothetical protein